MSDSECSIFTPGQSYIALRAFSRVGSHFRVGEKLVFKRVTFSHYDEVYCHEFISEDGTVKIWFQLPNEEPSDWVKYFKMFSESATSATRTMSYRVSVEQGLAAHFNQPNGPSRLGIDWVIKIEGPKNGAVIVRTYLKGTVADEQEKRLLSEKALDLIQRKIESGWDPSTQKSIMEIGDGPGN